MRALCRGAGLERVGVDDNFFALGGDSIVSIQLVSRARKAGLAITPRVVFQHQTVAALAAAAGSWGRAARGTGHRDRRRASNADHALAGGARRSDRAVQPGPAAAAACGAAGGSSGSAAGRARSSRCAAAAACRSGGRRVAAGDSAAGTVAAGDLLRRIDWRAEAGGLRTDANWRGPRKAGCRPRPGRWCRRSGSIRPASPGLLRLLIHHLSVDGVSWRILVPDLEAAWRAAAAGGRPVLRPRHLVPAGRGCWRCGRRIPAGCGELGQARDPGPADLQRCMRACSIRRGTAPAHGRSSAADPAVATHPPPADAGAGPVPRPRQRCAADRARGGQHRHDTGIEVSGYT